MDFEAKARELLAVLPARPRVTGAVEVLAVADALRAAALDEGAREAARAEMARLLADVRGRAHGPPLTIHVGEAASWDAPTEATSVADMENIDAAISAAILNSDAALLPHLPPGMGWTRTHTSALERLLWLLGLSEGERRFVTALAEDAGDFDLCSVYADWLEDQGRPEDGIRVRRLVPRDGDIIVMRYPEGAYEYQDVLKTLSAVEGHLKARGVDVFALALHDHDDLTALDPDAMRAAGWVRAEDVMARAGALQAYLKDRWGSAAERAVARHFLDLLAPSPPEPAPEAPP